MHSETRHYQQIGRTTLRTRVAIYIMNAFARYLTAVHKPELWFLSHGCDLSGENQGQSELPLN